MQSKITIFTVVDVIEALSGATLLNGSLCMMDNSPWHSINQGTPNLCTLCQPGQTIEWVVKAVDLQTPVVIKSITFIGADGSGAAETPANSVGVEDKTLELNVWSGIVPCYMLQGVEYKYRFEVQMDAGINSVMYIDTPSLKRVY